VSALARRLRAQDGFVLPGAIALLAIFAALTATALTLSLQSIDQTNRDRRVVRALQAADAGADVAIFRLNHMLVASGAGALGVAVGTVESLGCTSVDVATGFYSIKPPAAAEYCSATSGVAEDVEGATYSYRVANAVKALDGETLQRKILVTGTAGSAKRRVLVKVKLVINGEGSAVLYKRVRHTECTAEPTDASVPDSGCPGADLAD